MFACFKSRRRAGSASDNYAADGQQERATQMAVIKPRGLLPRRRRALEDKYELLHQVGEGKTGRVFLARRRRRSRASSGGGADQDGSALVAVKLVARDYLSTPNRVEALREELAALEHVKHPHALRLLDVFQEAERVAIVTEHARGGEVLTAICNSESMAGYCEQDVAAVVRQVLEVLAYLHARGITHRDVKVENILSKAPDVRNGGVVLIDFGLAHRGHVGRADMTGMNGTPHYMAPEMFDRNGAYGSAVDLWAVGVVAFVLLFGRYPFDAKFLSQVEDKIVAGQFEIPHELVSHDAAKFIRYLLVSDPLNRPPAALALQHPWLQPGAASTRAFSDEHMAQLRSFIQGKQVFGPPPP